MKRFIKIFLLGPLITLLISGCSQSNNEIIEKLNSIEKRYPLFMSFEGCINSITEKNPDSIIREAQLNIVSLNLIEAFKFLNEEIEYITSISINEENKDIMVRYYAEIGSLLSEHIKIFRLAYVEGSKSNTDYWGKLSLEGPNYDILKQVCENKTQKSIIKKEIENLTLMRFKKTVIVSPGEKKEEYDINSVSDYDLIPVKL